MRRLHIAGTFLIAAVPFIADAETRGEPFTPAQLTNASTLVVEATVLNVATVQKYKVRFPTKVEVIRVLKGKTDAKVLEFGHRPPGKYVIFPEEYNTPVVGQRGMVFLQENAGTLILNGYIAEPLQRFTLIWRETSTTPIEKVKTPDGFKISPAQAVKPIMARISRAPWAEFYLFVDATNYYFGNTRRGKELSEPQRGHWIINGTTGKQTYSEIEDTEPTNAPYSSPAAGSKR